MMSLYVLAEMFLQKAIKLLVQTVFPALDYHCTGSKQTVFPAQFLYFDADTAHSETTRIHQKRATRTIVLVASKDNLADYEMLSAHS
tara:strand:+ start:185 stop:445 length:261 start_codon:yes stop_codon:yes gene_type:complete